MQYIIYVYIYIYIYLPIALTPAQGSGPQPVSKVHKCVRMGNIFDRQHTRFDAVLPKLARGSRTTGDLAAFVLVPADQLPGAINIVVAAVLVCL